MENSANKSPGWWGLKHLRSGVGRTLLLWSLLISLLPLLAFNLFNYWQISRTLRQGIDQKLIAVSKLKAQQVDQFLQRALADAAVQAQSPPVQQYLMQVLQKGGSPVADAWSVGDLEQQAQDYLGLTGYQDLVLIDGQGNIVYARREKSWVGRNIFSGDNINTKLAQACRRSLSNKGPALADFEKAPLYNNAIAGFTVHPVYSQAGQHLGFVALRLATAQLNQIMHQDTGLGQDSEVGIIGTDLRLRNDSVLEEGPTAMGKPINTLQPQLWYKEHVLNNLPAEMEEKTSAYTGRLGLPIVAVHRHLEIDGVKMGIFAAAPQAESLAAIKKQRDICIILFAVTCAVVLLLSGRMVQFIVKPLLELNIWTQQVARGDLSKRAVSTPDNELGQLRDSFASMVGSLQEVTDVCQAVARGDFSRQIKARSEQDVLADSVNQMIDNLRGVVKQARAIAGGDYATRVTPMSENDELGTAIQAMVADLRRVRAENQQRNWLKNGLMAISDQMRGELAPAELAQRVLTTLARHLEARAAVFYLMDERRTLQLYASYAFTRRKNLSISYALGESLVGQAALEKKSIILTSVSEDYYLKITSGLGEAVPRNIAVVPLLYNGQVKGVVELATMTGLDDVQLEFLERATENIAIALETAQARQRMKELLEKTQQQAEELQVQQEELRQMNEELEEQTRILKESQSKLQDQQEELRQINEELEERTKALEKQRLALEQKNQELEEAQRKLQEKARDLELASRYKSEFLANMSHELRTPLNSVLILSKLLSENKEENLTAKQVEYAHTIYAAGSDLLSLINDILDLSKIESGKLELRPEQINIQQLAEDMEKYFRCQAQEKKLAFTVSVHPAVPRTIYADKQRLEQIIKNLLSNAFKFTEQGQVNVRFQLVNPPSRSGVEKQAAYTMLAIAVSDTGKGIAPDKQKIIFEAFQQEDGTISRRYGGTGLGLSISRELARLMGGEIRLVSQEGKGSTFTLYLPLSKASQVGESKPESSLPPLYPGDQHMVAPPAAAQAGAQLAASQPEPVVEQPATTDQAGGERLVLIIEDDRNFAGLLADLARQKGFQTAWAESGEKGIALARQLQPAAIILDIGLPGIDGWKVLEILKGDQLTRHIPVHFISAMDHSLEAMRRGAIGYLTKPVSPEDLDQVFQKIQDIISKKVKKLLVVEDDPQQRRSILELIGNGDVVTTAVGSGKEAYQLLRENAYDCVVLDLGLQDMSGFELLEKIKSDPAISYIPVIIYTGRELSREEENILNAHAESIIVKGAKSPERLLYETTLFLHRVEANLPPEQRKALRILHNKDQVFQGKKILLADDDMRNVFALLSILEEKGMEILVARNGREALQKLAEHPDTDLVLMDIMMPEMDGYQAMREIRKQERFKYLPIIALTAKAMKGDREKSIAAGASDYLSKPVDPDKLLSLLRVWLYR
ncbi:MAG: response regulator [Bacillota bacterium]|uniref:response regulator n=1 Tax=Desulfurispora thermophila TaxID=265470 RepID=UPI0003A65CBD|nr:response regulator [Desulfurispora thermophila]